VDDAIEDGVGKSWIAATPSAELDAAASKQPLLENLVGPLDRQRPADPGRPRSFEIVLDGAARYSECAPDLTRAYAVVVQTQHLPQLSHGQLSSGRHQTLLADREGLKT